MIATELSPKFKKVLDRLNQVSEKKQMNLTTSHPWDEVYSDEVWLKKPENLSIYGTPYYELATEEELKRLARFETGAWWNTFIIFENLVTEYYMKIINHESLRQFPAVVEYMHHFCKEEIVHALVFRKGMEHFKIDPYPVPENLKDFYKDNASLADFPLKAVFLTIIIEWFAENNAILDLNNDQVSPLARAIAVEHHKEEARHIEWGRSMVREFCQQVPGFLDDAKEYTPLFMRNLLDMSTANPETYDRVNFSHPAFQDREKLYETVLFCDNRKRINQAIMRPLIKFFVEVGIYDENYHELWQAARFEEDIKLALKKSDRPVIVGN